MQNNPTNYVGNGWSRSTQYGEILNIKVNLEKLSQLPVDNYGNVKLTVKKLREPNPKSKATHSVAEDSYTPQPKTNYNDFEVNSPF